MKFGEVKSTQPQKVAVKKVRKLDKSKYNVTDLDPETVFERHIFHRDQFAHYLRWTHILKEAKIGDKIVDFGCGKGNLLEVLYRNRFKCEKYIGLDIRETVIEEAREKYSVVDWAEFDAMDLLYPDVDLNYGADRVCSFEVMEHVGKQNADLFLKNFRRCGGPNATYYLSTPNHDEKVGAAGNHTYDSGDGRGVAVQEFTHEELIHYLSKYFDIQEYYGTFASVKDYKHLMNDWQKEMFKELNAYYDSNLISVIMAPFFPAQARNTIWIMKAKPETEEEKAERHDYLVKSEEEHFPGVDTVETDLQEKKDDVDFF